MSDREQIKFHSEQKPETEAKKEASVMQETPEILRDQIEKQAAGNVANFKKEGSQRLEAIENRAASAGLTIENSDKAEFNELNQEAESARQELLSGISDPTFLSPPIHQESATTSSPIGSEELRAAISTKDEEAERVDSKEKDKNIVDSSRDISSVFTSILEDNLQVENIFTEIDRIQQDIDILQENSIKKIFNYFKIKRLSSERSTKEQKVSALMSDIALAEKLLSEFIGQIDEKHKSAAIMEYAKSHFKDDPERMNQINTIENERKKRSVEVSMLRNNAFVFHGIRDKKSGPVGTRASNLKQEAQQDIRIKVALALEPSLSTSSFKNEGIKQGLWSDTGLLLRSGYIDAAKSWDMHTYIEDVNDRGNLTITTASDIDRIIRERRMLSGGVAWYNEIVVRNPKFAGLCVGKLEVNKDLVKLTEELDMPIFFHDGKGRVFETSLKSESNNFTLIPGKEVMPSDIVNSKYDIFEDRRKDLIQEVIKDDIFNIDERLKSIQEL